MMFSKFSSLFVSLRAAGILAFAAAIAVSPMAVSGLHASTNDKSVQTSVKSPSAVYIREARENASANAPATAQSYKGLPSYHGFGDDVSRAGVSFPVSFD